MSYGDTSFLFTGDAEQEEQQLLMYNDYEDLKADVLKADHHVPKERQKALTTYHNGLWKLYRSTNSCGEELMTEDGI